jgi:sugar phosphate isomerase/epimerase
VRLGIIVGLAGGPEPCLEKVRQLGLPTCQVSVSASERLSDSLARDLRQAADDREIEITSIWTHCRGGQVWNFGEGPRTIGLVPAETRAAAVARLKAGSDFARAAGVAGITTHAGFIPEDPNDPVYAAVVAALREVAEHCQRNGQHFCLETGQETPVTLLRAIEDVGVGGLGVNLDPANLLMYGKANPVDALDVIGRFVRGVHAKDGEYPTDGRRLGAERPLGAGRVDVPRFMARLKALGYDGAVTIEREVSGPEQIAGIEQARRLLEPLL